MKTLVTVAALAAATLAVAGAGAATAQPRGQTGFGAGPGSGPSLTLYDLPNFQGGSRTYTAGVANLADIGLNDRAQSARVQGRWRICEDANLRGRCTEINGDQPNLATIRMTAAISSFESLDRPQQGGGRDDRGGYGGGGFNGGGYGGRDDRGPPGSPPGYDSRDYAGPSTDGRTVSFFPRPTPGPYRNADEFCRRLGFNGVVYADDRGPAIRDVVCRR